MSYLPVQNLPEQYFYRLIPEGIVGLDKKGLMDAVTGGYQDRVSDLRTAVNGLVNQQIVNDSVVLVKITGQAGQIITRTLDLTEDAPDSTDTDALTLWAADQLGLTTDQILAVVVGTDALRTTTIDKVGLLAGSLGAFLYSGLHDDTPDQIAATRQLLLDSYFPRLRLKGTAKSFELLGRALGFDSVSMVPLWSRFLPKFPGDPGADVNANDYYAAPDQEPAESLPDSRYNPQEVFDGDYFTWSYTEPTPSTVTGSYWEGKINGKNPLVKVTALGDVDMTTTPTFRARLSGANPGTQSSVSPAGTNLLFESLFTGVSQNDIFITYADNILSVIGRLSTIKYRSNFYSLKGAISSSATLPIQPNRSLETNPTVDPAGTAVAPFRPWTGGKTTRPVTLFPNVIVGSGTQVVSKLQAPANLTQLDPAPFQSALNLLEATDSLRPATRRILSKATGLGFTSTFGYAPYTKSASLFTVNTGSNSSFHGNLVTDVLPPYQVDFQAYGTDLLPQPTYVDEFESGTVSVAGDNFQGIYRTRDHYYSFQVQSGGLFGSGASMVAEFLAGPSPMVRGEPGSVTKSSGNLAYLSRPQDRLDIDEAYGPVGSIPSGIIASTTLPLVSSAGTSGYTLIVRYDTGNGKLSSLVLKDVHGGTVTPSSTAVTSPTGGSASSLTSFSGAWTSFFLTALFVLGDASQLSLVDSYYGDLGPVREPLHFFDDFPWRREPLFVGREQDLNIFKPTAGDLPLIPISVSAPSQAISLSGRQYELAVLDSSTVYPYRFKVLAAQELDLVTGEPVNNKLSQLLYAQDGNGNLYPVLLIDNLVVSQQYWSPSRYTNAIHWVPLNEHPNDAITPYNRYSSSSDDNLSYDNRLWDSDRGWVRALGDESAVSYFHAVELTAFTLGLWANYSTNTVGTGYSPIATLRFENQDVVALGINQSGSLQFGAMLPSDILANTASGNTVVVANSWTYVVLRYFNKVLQVGTFKLGNGGFVWIDVNVDLGLTIVDELKLSGSVAIPQLSDLTVWSVEVDDLTLKGIAQPTCSPTEVELPTPYVESLNRNNRYTFKLQLTSGFAYPSRSTTGDVTELPADLSYIQRYSVNGRYRGADCFKLVGLGDGDAIQSSYKLGLQGVSVGGDGRALVSSPYPTPNGFSQVWANPAGSYVRVSSPFNSSGGTDSTQSTASTPWPNLSLTNPAKQHAYIQGDDGLVYKVYIDNLGSGPVLVAESTLRGTVDEPTDSVSLLSRSTSRLSVQLSGSLPVPYEKSQSQPYTTAPLYLYCSTQQVINAATALTRWSNPSQFGLNNSVPSLANNGTLVFANSENLGIGVYELELDVGNLGLLDPSFEGYSVDIAITEGTGSVLTSVSATLLPTGTGDSPRGKTVVEIELDTPTNTSSLLTLRWNNDRDVPRKNQKRQLAVYGYTLRLINPILYQVSLPLTLTPIDLTNIATPTPGGLLAEINSYGTVSALRHEATIFPDSSSLPLSHLLTTSTLKRRETLRVNNPTLPANPTIPSAPTVVSVGPSPDILYSLGNEVTINAIVSDTTKVVAYVWRFWDNSVLVTSVPTVQKIVTQGVGTTYVGTVSLTIVDSLGQHNQGTGTVQFNYTPSVQITSSRNSGVLPYISTLTAVATDPDLQTLSYSWAVDGTTVSTASSFDFTVSNPDTMVICTVTDGAGGISTPFVLLDGVFRQQPMVSPIIRRSIGRISDTNVMEFAVYALDPNTGGNLTFNWQFWNATTSTGITQQVANSNARFNQAICPLIGSTPGDKMVRLTVTDEAGYQTVLQTTTTLLANSAPTLVGIKTAAPAAAAGAKVVFTANANDIDGNELSYTWVFTSPRAMTLYGGSVSYPTLDGDVDQLIIGELTVADTSNSTATMATPVVELVNQFLKPLQVSVAPGYYSSGVNVSIVAPDNDDTVTIRYSIDGTEIFAVTDGLPYQGQFALTPNGAAGVVTLKARGFKDNIAPTIEFSGVYTFYDPTNPTGSANPSVGTGTSKISVVDISSNSDSVITTATGTNIPGDSGTTISDPTASFPEYDLSNSPALPFSPLPPPGVTVTTIKRYNAFVLLKTPI